MSIDLDKKLAALVGEGELQVPGLGVLLYKNGKLVYSFCSGRSYIGTDGKADKPFQLNSIFRIASLSKQFTVFALMQLVEQGKLSLDDDVSKYLGFQLRHPAFVEIKITVKMLASHTSGLRDGKVYSISPDMSLKEFFVPDGLFFESGAHFSPMYEKPGEYFCYCNLNYGILGTIVEIVSNQRLDLYLKENVFSKMEMEAEFLPGNFTEEAFKRLGCIYRKQDHQGIWDSNGSWYAHMDDFSEKIEPDQVVLQNPYAEMVNGKYSLNNYVAGTNATALSPQGGLRTSVEGLGHTLEMLLNNGVYKDRKILSAKSLQEIFKLHWQYDAVRYNGDTCNGTLLNYGLGEYFIAGDSSARVCENLCLDLWGHTGQAFGLLSGMFHIAGSKDGFVYIMNGEAMPEEVEQTMGRYSGNFIWEEQLMNILCEAIYENL